ncbi:uncharacterized protein [Eleutherodactylus coqui]|uniref:uncharacterized protein isoform X2 n=1 Tax=Eleutherodactylus coqui TaxID=57060 RepID=UPI003462952F
MRVHLFLMTAYVITATDANSTTPTSNETEHVTSHVLDTVNHTALPPEGHKNTSETHEVHKDPPETHGNHTAPPPKSHENTSETRGTHMPLSPEVHKDPPETHGSLSKPTIEYNLLDGNAMQITCFSKSGSLPIRYQLFLYNRMLEEKVVSRPVAAHFTFPMTPHYGPQVYFNCTAISPTGEKSSNNLTIPVADSTVGPEDVEVDQKDKETEPEHLIPLQYILTSVSPEILQWNTLVLITCGPIILFLLVTVIVISYLRGQYTESILMDSRAV